MRLTKLIVLCCMLATAGAGFAADGSMLKPPAGASVAIIVFEDLECPACAQAAPLLEQAEKTYNVPLIIRDFPLRQHQWAYDAAVIARYIEQKYGHTVSDQFRDYIYQNQPQITKDNMRSFADRFAAGQKIQLPFMLDPQGQLAAGIKADQDLGTKTQLIETPTIFVVSNNDWKQVTDRGQLYNIIDKMKREAPPAQAAKTAAKTGTAKKATTKKN